MRRGIVAEKSTRLAGVRGGVEQGLDVFDEAHVEHLVGLVEDDDLELVQPQRAAVHQVDRAAGGGDDDVDALGQAAQLRADGGAAVDGEHAGAHAPAVAGDGLGDLQRELAGRGEDEAERGGAAGAARALLAQALQHRQREGGRLAGAGRGLTDQVTALDQRRDRLGLDRGGDGVAERGDGPLELGAQREVGEARALLGEGLGGLEQGRVNDNVVQCHVCLSSNGTGARTVHPRGEARGRDGTQPDSGLSRFTTSNRQEIIPLGVARPRAGGHTGERYGGAPGCERDPGRGDVVKATFRTSHALNVAFRTTSAAACAGQGRLRRRRRSASRSPG